jgi:hypothetical protein
VSRLVLPCALLALGLAAGCGEHWEPLEAVLPGLQRLDTNADGALDQAELQRGSPVPVDLAGVDLDGDQRVDPPELLAMLRATDPGTFDGVEAPMDPQRDDLALMQPDPREVRCVRELLEFMATEIHQAAPGRPIPRPEAIEAAARTGALDSPEAVAVAAELVALYSELEMMLPPALQGVEPAAAP